MLVLDVWHAGLFLEEAYLDGTLQYEDLGEYSSDQEAAFVFSAVLNIRDMDTPSACMLRHLHCGTIRLTYLP